ncbi:threonine--tRNA ligase [Arthrobacter crystallopoietes]|uniref:Threonine--tRNA ligase n=1 Tax=Crystallibacter crystallopoietes TaxID=37928 RepID=A0A1H1GD70_9MICC|nr:threonine--tRNA ligase [Arthrobacter crystallopoietes]AUI52630.1 threonine--tRNA ligase [Arthrobacter crystallopoietes]SDR11194.1 threonyl-tRNA synthetase [Arthrobacter crystallopoietes]
MSAPQNMTLIVDGEEKQVNTGITGAELFFERRDVVVMRVDGVLKDLDQPLSEDAKIESVTIDSPDGLNVLRHSTAHVMAQAVQQLRPDAKLGIGPYITDGFYFDFDVEEPFTPDDLKTLEKMMLKIVNQNQKFARRVVTEDEARAAMADEPYKLILLDKSAEADEAGEGVNVEVGAGEITIYDNVDRKTGDTIWCDLCRGPHLPNTKLISNAFALTRSAAAYWLGNEKNKQLQRIYGTAWPTKEALKAYQERLAEAERRDHRKLGSELDLFSFPDELGSGLPVFHPKGGIVRKAMEDYSRQRHTEAGYDFVYTPHITKGHLYEVSGHLDWYRDGMFPPIHVDETRDPETNEVVKPGQDYYLKPMNCPMHNLIFRSRGRSYRELPLRMFEFGSVYRYEKSGVVHGLTRVRGMTQDDAHIYCTREQMKDELTNTLNFVLALLKDYGLDDFYLELSTKDPEKYVGADEVWDEATRTLAEVAEASGLELVPDPGGAAFYGPKISVQARDAIGRTWQMSTIQLDFNLPERFELEYQAADGSRQRPVMIHRALFGSVERFMGVLIEHYAGAFPAWLAPVQVVGIPVAEAFNDYMGEVIAKLKAAGIRAEADFGSDRFPKKIRTASKDKIPFVLIAGGEDAEAGAVSFRFRDGSQDNGVPVDGAVARIVEAVRNRDHQL